MVGVFNCKEQKRKWYWYWYVLTVPTGNLCTKIRKEVRVSKMQTKKCGIRVLGVILQIYSNLLEETTYRTYRF